MRNNIKRRHQTFSLSLTPMIDVMTVLLAVFMVTAPLMQSGINFDLPKGGKSTLNTSEHTVNIGVDKYGRYFFNNTVMDKDQIIKKSVAMFKTNPNLSIVISGDNKASYGAVITMMAGLKDAGFQKVGLKTKIDKQYE